MPHRRLRICILIAGSACACACTTAQSCEDLAGHWQNEMGSLLVIDSITTRHEIIGEYRSSTGTDGDIYPLHGWVNNYQQQDAENAVSMSFSVRWEGYQSITSWTGYCDTDDTGPHIKTLWHLVRPATEFPWERVIANSSVFRPTELDGN